MKLKEKYRLEFTDLKKSAFRNKLLFLFLVCEAVFVTLFLNFYEPGSGDSNILTIKVLLILCTIFSIPFLVLVLFIKTISLGNHQQYLTYRYHFKKDVINSLRLICSEIQDYIFNQKLNPHYFTDSGLFGKSYIDYRGDDWLKCAYNGVDYELCELEVTRLFRKNFHGIFIVGYFPEGISDNQEKIAALLNEFMKTNNKKAVFSTAQEFLYIAIHLDTPYLECENEKQVLDVENQIKFTENILLLMREIIDK